MEFLDTLPLALLAVLIFLCRVIDVSLGTCRTIAVVQGRMVTSVALGFIEVLVWVTTVTHVIHHASSNPWLLFSYASGFAAGNAVGIAVERRLALGGVILRIVSRTEGDRLSVALRKYAPQVYQFEGSDNGETMTLLYVAVRRRDARQLIEESLLLDPHLFYALDLLRESNLTTMSTMPPTPATGWRAILKKK